MRHVGRAPCPQQTQGFSVDLILLVWVGVGGALGSIARYLLSVAIEWQQPTGFPYATLVVNTVGSLILGFVTAYWIASTTLSAELRLFLTVGFCGGFTTFSTFGYETARLLESGSYRMAALNASLNIGLSLFATFAGFALARRLT